MKKLVLVFLSLMLMGGCASQKPNTYQQISPEQAKAVMDGDTPYYLLDSRTDEEFAAGHIPGAVLLPEYAVKERAEQLFPNKKQTILVYCRSGRRSKIAAQALADLGYTDVREFGGIIDWQYETTTE